MSDARRERLADFVAGAHAHVTGDEKGQAQIFLDRLFQAFGQHGRLDVGGEPEMRIRKAKEDGGAVKQAQSKSLGAFFRFVACEIWALGTPFPRYVGWTLT